MSVERFSMSKEQILEQIFNDNVEKVDDFGKMGVSRERLYELGEVSASTLSSMLSNQFAVEALMGRGVGLEQLSELGREPNKLHLMLNAYDPNIKGLMDRGVKFEQLSELGCKDDVFSLNNLRPLMNVLQNPDCNWVKKHSNEQKAYTQGAVGGMFESLEYEPNEKGAMHLPADVGSVVGEFLTQIEGAKVAEVNKKATEMAKEKKSHTEKLLEEKNNSTKER
jgi:hypothetical protein